MDKSVKGTKDLNRIKVVLVEKKRTNRWLAEQLGKDERNGPTVGLPSNWGKTKPPHQSGAPIRCSQILRHSSR